jgi:2-alkyl-3-oxoalkanoate reductase
LKELEMKIFVAGATGAIGRPLIAQLMMEGYDVIALTRSPEKAQSLAAKGVKPVIADVFDAEAIQVAISHVQPDVVIEQLTSLPTTYTPAAMKAAAARNNRIRLEGGANVLAAAQASGVQRYIVSRSHFGQLLVLV